MDTACWREGRAGPLVAVVFLHAAAISGLLAIPAVREHAGAPRLLDVVIVREDRPRPPPPAPPVAPPRLREAAVVSIPPPEIAISVPATATAVHIAPALAPVTPVEAAADAPKSPAVPMDPPRYDVAYLRNPAPAYPPLSRRMKEEGRVMLRVRVGAGGEPRDVQVASSSGSERLDHAAVEAVRRWRFAPAHRGDEAVEAWALVPISFRLDA